MWREEGEEERERAREEAERREAAAAARRGREEFERRGLEQRAAGGGVVRATQAAVAEVRRKNGLVSCFVGSSCARPPVSLQVGAAVAVASRAFVWGLPPLGERSWPIDRPVDACLACSWHACTSWVR